MDIACNECGKKQNEQRTSARKPFTLIRIGHDGVHGNTHVFYCSKCMNGITVVPTKGHPNGR